MLCQWCHLVARSGVHRLAWKPWRREHSFHAAVLVSQNGISTLSSKPLTNPAPAHRLGHCTWSGDSAVRRRTFHSPSVTGRRDSVGRGLGAIQVCSRRSSSDGGEGIPVAGRYRSPWTILKEEFKGVARGQDLDCVVPVPRETDVLIIGGGAVGSSVAYWLKERNPKGMTVTVVERDPCYTRASTMLSVGGIRHQFSIEENVQLSMFTSDFLRNIKEHLSVLDESPPDVQFNHQGYLFLAPTRAAPLLEKNVHMQRKLGGKIDLLSKEQLAAKFPWLNTTGVEVGSYGLDGEGWFDPYLLVQALKRKNVSLGVRYVQGELEEFSSTRGHAYVKDDPTETLTSATIRTRDDALHGCKFAMVINCAGPWAGEVARKAKIGVSDTLELMTPLPVEPRKRYVYVLHCPKGPSVGCPLTVDPSGVYFRPEGYGGFFLAGCSPDEDKEPTCDNLNVDYDYFEEFIWPKLANRVPVFQSLKLKSAWAGFYDYNYMDQNLVIGNHPYHHNFFFANGLSGHGLQHSVAVGRALSELIIDGEYKTIDLSRFCFERFMTEDLLEEEKIV